jgi:hypothetical protein
MGMFRHLYLWKSEVVVYDSDCGEVEVLETFWDHPNETSAVLAAAKFMEHLIATDPEVHRHQLSVDVSSNWNFIDTLGPDEGVSCYEVVEVYDFFSAMNVLLVDRGLTGKSNDRPKPPTWMIERVLCMTEQIDGWEVISNGYEHGIEFYVLGGQGGFLKHIRITALSLQGFEEFASSVWQAVEWLGRIDAKRKVEDPF